ncbi:hypothetical protein [Methylorubrum extorquens]|uniref:Uncharacterized protein n=1 Tax=Methylorubrum extorquens (strain ATCC 14718 / DSM 1338 / JCM 2805 / NCIMB 9133 / AM1) TaxID=272630 RepID=C5ARP1_METEA|nr:hypothetical protein [Methylorubrum extorquens]ACS42379.1 Hypothetical protein MexAM1_META1p4752 [Methylorubrum extorquens AM1]MCP1544568.1 hypothetical protein [Methylorubrum extorquens]MCP1588085.1 hypothetical protein [Methylorubrum extorquens]
MTIPTIADVTAAWHSLSSEKRDFIGIMVVDMVLQGFISGESYIAGGQPEDLAVLDENVRGNAKCAEDELLTTLTRVVEAALPRLFGADGENPMWCDNPGPRSALEAVVALSLKPLPPSHTDPAA